MGIREQGVSTALRNVRRLALAWALIAGLSSCADIGQTLDLPRVFPDPLQLRLVRAAVATDLPGMEQAVHAGANPNYFGLNGINALMAVLGAPNHNTVSAKKLIDLGADLNRVAKGGAAAAWYAEAGDNLAIAEWVLQNGGSPSTEDYFGEPVVVTAVKANRLENIKLLVRYGLDVNRASQGQTGALTAARMARYKILLFFLQNGYTYKLKATTFSFYNHSPPEDPQDKAAVTQIIAILKARGQKWPPDDIPRQMVPPVAVDGKSY